MALAKRANEWDHTSNILALMANLNTSKKTKPEGYTALDFTPRDLKPVKTKEEIEAEEFDRKLDRIARLPPDKYEEAFDRLFREYNKDAETNGSE